MKAKNNFVVIDLLQEKLGLEFPELRLVSRFPGLCRPLVMTHMEIIGVVILAEEGGATELQPLDFILFLFLNFFMTKKIIGVLGGMGPESTAIFYQALIRECQRQYGAKLDSDYPEIFIYNLPIPDIIEGLKEPEKTLEMLVGGARKMQSIGVDFIVMPCNTAHYFYPGMAKAIQIPFICIFLVAAKKIAANGYSKIGFLATETTVRYKSYDRDFEKNGIDLILPEDGDQRKLTRIILNILAGKKFAEDKRDLRAIIQRLKKRRAEAVLLACTDLPILLSGEDISGVDNKMTDLSFRLFDTVDILAEATIQYATGKIGNEILE